MAGNANPRDLRILSILQKRKYNCLRRELLKCNEGCNQRIKHFILLQMCFVNCDDLDVRARDHDDGVGDVRDGDHGDVHGDGARDVHELHHEWRVQSFRRYFHCDVQDVDHGDDHGDDHDDGGADYSFSNTVRCDP